jgi:hypothetical protein
MTASVESEQKTVANSLDTMRLKTFVQLNCLLLFLFWCSPASAQQRIGDVSKKSITYGFVSPNTREGLKLDDAIRGLRTSEEDQLIRNARRMGCVAQSEMAAFKSVGSWSDGAEHSVLLRSHTDALAMRYIVSVLGRNAEQKAALYFHSESSGPAEIYILRSRRTGPIQRLARTLDEAGIEFRTLVPTKATILVYVVDLKRELGAKVIAAAKKLKARVTSRRGSAEFIGDDSSRDKARTLFDNEIREYESRHADLVTQCGLRHRNFQR